MERLEPDIWRDLAVLLAVSETKSSFGASRILHISNDAVAMRVEQLETRVGAALVDRSTPRWVLTDAGKGLVQKTRSIVSLVERGAGSDSTSKDAPRPLVLNCPDLLFEFVLLPLWYRIETKLPEVSIKLQTQKGLTSQPDSSYDLALCLGPKGQAESFCHAVGEIHFALYAHRDLVGAHTRERTPSHFTVQTPELSLPDLVWPGGATTRRVVCDELLLVVTAVKSGKGIGLIPRFIGDADPALVPLEGADVSPMMLSIFCSTSKAAAKPDTQLLRNLLAREIASVLRVHPLRKQQASP